MFPPLIKIPWLRLSFAVMLLPSSFFAKMPSEQFFTVIREQIAGSPEKSEVYVENTRLRFIRVWGGTVVFPHKAALFVMTFPENRVGDRRVFFIERDRDAVRELRRRTDTRISGLIVSPEEVPGAYFKTPPGPNKINGSERVLK